MQLLKKRMRSPFGQSGEGPHLHVRNAGISMNGEHRARCFCVVKKRQNGKAITITGIGEAERRRRVRVRREVRATFLDKDRRLRSEA